MTEHAEDLLRILVGGIPVLLFIFGWFVKDFAGTQFEDISAKAAVLKPGASGLVALDWLNGNRSVLMIANLTGVVLGLTLDSRPEEVYRAWVEDKEPRRNSPAGASASLASATSARSSPARRGPSAWSPC